MLTTVIAVAIFALSYIIIISEKVHRTVIAMVGAMAMVIMGVLHQEQAIEGIDFNTIGLLIGMMVVVNIARHSGMFEAVALWTAKVGRGEPWRVFILMGLTIAVFSALLDNVTTVLLMTPVIFVISHNLKLNPIPLLVAAILMSNIGGAATLIGDPPNIMIGSAAGLSFNDFLFNLAPVSIIISLVTIGMLTWWYRGQLVASAEAKATVAAFKPASAITDYKLLVKSLVVLGLIIVGFITHSMTGLEGATIALAGAALLLLLTMHDPEHHLRDVEWTTIFFFVGLFILVGGLEHVGVIRMMAEYLLEATGGNLLATTMVVLWGSAVLSAIVDNIPYVATMIPLVKDIGAISGINLTPLWWALALGADIGGNATIIGASANVVVSGMAEKQGYKLSFMGYAKVAVPMTVVAMLICTVYVYFRYF